MWTGRARNSLEPDIDQSDSIKIKKHQGILQTSSLSFPYMQTATDCSLGQDTPTSSPSSRSRLLTATRLSRDFVGHFPDYATASFPRLFSYLGIYVRTSSLDFVCIVNGSIRTHSRVVRFPFSSVSNRINNHYISAGFSG